MMSLHVELSTTSRFVSTDSMTEEAAASVRPDSARAVFRARHGRRRSSGKPRCFLAHGGLLLGDSSTPQRVACESVHGGLVVWYSTPPPTVALLPRIPPCPSSVQSCIPCNLPQRPRKIMFFLKRTNMENYAALYLLLLVATC